MNICFLHRWFPPNGGYIGGIVPYLQTMASALAAAGHGVFVFTEATEETPQGLSRENGLTVFRMPKPGRCSDVPGQLLHLRAIGCVLERFTQVHGIDIIETCDWGAETLFFRPSPHHAPRVLLKLHCPIAVSNAALRKRPRLRGYLYQWMERRAILQADHVLSPSRLCGERTKELLRLPQLPITIVPNPIDTGYWQAAPTSPREQRLLFAGRLERMKGVSRLAPLLDPLLLKHPQLVMRFVGSDSRQAPHGESMMSYLRRQVHPTRQERLQFTGPLPRTQLVSEYQEATACWLPSLFESFSLVCTEAMACETPVIGSHTTAMAEIIEDGRSGFVVDFDDPQQVMARVSWLLEAGEAQHKMAQAARERIIRYCGIPQVVSWYENMFSTIRYHHQEQNSPSKTAVTAP